MTVSRSPRLDPNRPSLGPLFFACLAAWGACLAAESLTWELHSCSRLPQGYAVVVVVLGFLLVGVLAAAACVERKARMGKKARALRLFIVPVVALVCSLTCAGLFWTAWEAQGDALQDALSGCDGVSAELTGDPAAREYGVVSTACWHAGGRSVSFRILWPEGAEPLKAGHLVRIEGSLSRPAADESGRWNHRQGYVGMVAAQVVEDRGSATGLRGLVSAFREESSIRIEQMGDDAPSSGLLAGIVLGDRSLYTGSETEQDFRTTGLAHLMAVSGTHLAVVTGLLSCLLARTPLRRGTRALLIASGLVFYVSLTGFAPSALRSFVMCLCALAAGSARRRAHVVSALSLCVLVFVCACPPLAFSLGFQLSVLAVFGLVVLSPLAAAWLRSLLPGRLSSLADSLAATFSATLTTLPVTIPLFAQLPLVSPVATLLAAPFVTCALALGIPGVLLAATGLPCCAVPLQAALSVCGACAWLVHLLADLPLACVPVSSDGRLVGIVFAAMALVLWALWPLPSRLLVVSASIARPAPEGKRLAARRLAVALVFALPVALVVFEGAGGSASLRRAFEPHFSSDARVVMIDVGQGDCTLVEDGDAAVLVDTGKDAILLEQGLARRGISHLDAVYLTHKDADHCGALAALAGVVRVDHVYVHADLLGNPVMQDVLRDATWVTAGRGAEGVSVGDQTRAGRFTLTLVSPEDGGESENDDSLVNLVEYDEDADGVPEARGLLTGDAEAEVTAPLADTIGRIDLLKVSHHGSRGGATDAELATLSPKVALIGVGADNAYGHPTPETLSELERAGARVFRTDLNGDIEVDFSGTRMSVKLQKDG